MKIRAARLVGSIPDLNFSLAIQTKNRLPNLFSVELIEIGRNFEKKTDSRIGHWIDQKVAISKTVLPDLYS